MLLENRNAIIYGAGGGIGGGVTGTIANVSCGLLPG